MKLDAEALRELGRASAAKAEADRLDRQRQAILRTLLQAAAFAADVRAGHCSGAARSSPRSRGDRSAPLTAAS
jgi:hypothetical protein